MAQPASADRLRQVIAETLHHSADIRRNAEAQLKAAQTTPNHLLEVLQLVANADASNAAVRQAAAVHFKNTVKKGWDVNREDGTDGIVISPDDRNTIKSHLVQLMCTVPGQIQVQLSESISLIAAVDYPENWTNLLGELVQQFNSTNPDVVVGVLKTANSIFRSFRYVQRSDALYRVIIHTLNGIQAPLLTLFMTTGQAVEAMANDPVQLKPRFEALRLICRIFYSLNYQDLPEFFEDHMGEWMGEFAKYLKYQNPVLMDPDEETEPSPIDKLQVAIIENLSLYADKDEETFMQFLPNFTTLVWNLLMNATAYPKHDILATTSIRFLSSLVQKYMHRDLFKDEATLRQIVQKIVIPNLMFRESDEERFEDDPREFIVTEVEGSDSESRRRCSQVLLKAMCRQFEAETTKICSEHVTTMLTEFSADPNGKWRAKDAAIHLMIGIAIKKESSQVGVSEVNQSVNVLDFFQSQILPELQDSNHTVRPVLKAAAIKFVSIFRNQFAKEHLVQLMPLLIAHLQSPIVVVHTFGAYSLERILFMKQETAGVGKRPMIQSTDLTPFLEPLFNALFTIIDNEEQNENDYVMKCVMRALVSAREEIVPVTQVVITKLTTALGRVAKNPRNPQFNHFLFESIAVLVRSVCSKDPNATSAFEPLLFPPFNLILQADVVEFTPYVFQVLAQLLEYRPATAGLGESFEQLFPPLLTPVAWEKRGNVPALTRLMKAYIEKAAPHLVQHLDPILGVFQSLLAVKATEISAFDLLTSAVVRFPQEAMEPRLVMIFRLLFVRLQAGKSPRYVGLVTNFFAMFVGKFGAQVFIDRLDSMQAGMAAMFLGQIWCPRMKTDPPRQRLDAKIQVVGLTRLLCDGPGLLASRNAAAWSETLTVLVMLLTSTSFGPTSSALDDEADVEIGFDAQFSQLNFAKKKAEDPFPEVSDPPATFVRSLKELMSALPTQINPLLQQVSTADPKIASSLDGMLQRAV